MKKSRLLGYVLFFSILLPLSAADALQVQYEIIDLGVLTNSPGNDYSYGSTINDYGQATGTARTINGVDHAFLYDNGVMTDIGGGPFNEVRSFGVSINNAGQIAGGVYQMVGGGSRLRAYIYENGVMTDLGTLGGSESNPRDINESGQIVGSSDDVNNNNGAFLYENGAMTPLGTLDFQFSQASSINDNGQIVGRLSSSCSIESCEADHAFLYENGVMTDLGPIGVLSSINNNGQIVGNYQTNDNDTHAFLFENGVMTDLGTLGGPESAALDINDNGQIVGWSINEIGEYHGFYYENGTMIGLGDLGGAYSHASSINEDGQIVGMSIAALGQERAVLWQPTIAPLPTTVWLFGSGLLGLIGVARRKVRG